MITALICAAAGIGLTIGTIVGLLVYAVPRQSRAGFLVRHD